MSSRFRPSPFEMGQYMKNLLSGRFSDESLVVDYAKGARLYSSDKAYLDFVLGNLTQIFGHNRLDLQERLIETLSRFANIGDHRHQASFDLATRILSIANQESLRFTNSGSEAAHLAVRTARAKSGRTKIVKFVGHYHGWFDEEIATFLKSKSSAGLTPGSADHVIMLQWNDAEGIAHVCEHLEDIAAIICEPVLAHAGTIPPREGFLQLLRELCTANGVALIFDECITGFRVALGGAQELYGVNADYVVYSKALSNGFPFGVLCGKAEFMEPLRDGSVFHASTYDGNPLSIAIVGMVLDELERGEALNAIRLYTNELAGRLSTTLENNGFNVCCQSVPGIFQTFFTDLDSVDNYSDAMSTATTNHLRLKRHLMRDMIDISVGEITHEQTTRNWLGSWFLSSSHNEEVIDRVIASASTFKPAL